MPILKAFLKDLHFYGTLLLTLLTLLTSLKPSKNGPLSQFVMLQNNFFVLYYSQCEEEKIDFCEIKIQVFTSKIGLNLLK